MGFVKEDGKIYIAGTGHRPSKIPGGYEDYMYKGLNYLIDLSKNFLKKGVDKGKDLVVITGMAQGWDTAIAIAAYQLEIPVVCAIPCKDQEKVWPETSQNMYKKILSKASHVETLSKVYFVECLQIRNQWMVDRCDVVLAYHNGSKGGTNNCIKYAKKNKKKIYNLYKKEDFEK